MLIIRLRKYFEFLEYLCNFFGAIAFSFNYKTQTFSVNPNQQQKLSRNCNLTLLWLLLTFLIVHRHNSSDNFDNFNQGLTFGLVLLLETAGLSITRWFTHDLGIYVNDNILFLQFLHRKRIYNF